MYTDTILYNILINDSTLVSLLDSYGTDPAIFYDVIIPEDMSGFKTINYYLVEPIDVSAVLIREVYILNCRADSKTSADAIAKQTAELLNRKTLDINTFSTSKILTTIPPIDNTDVYNTPVEITIKQRGIAGI